MRRSKLVLIAVPAFLFAVCGFAEDVKLNGVWYRDVRWGTPTPVEVSLFHKEGVVKLMLGDLPPDLQQRFGYDPAKAAAHREGQEQKWKEERLQRERSASAPQADSGNSTVSLTVIDGDNFYLRRRMVKTLYGPFPCVVGSTFAVEGKTYEIVRATNLLFTVKSPVTKNVLGPFWLKDGYDVVLDGVSYSLLRPSTVAKEKEKIRDEYAMITEIQATQSPTQQVLELQNRLAGSDGVGEKKGLGIGAITNESLRKVQ